MLDFVPAPLVGVLVTLVVEYAAFWCYVLAAVLLERRNRVRS